VTPAATTTYTLTATDSYGSSSASVTVTVTPVQVTTYSLTVDGGFGSGTYSANSTVDIFANPANATSSFNMWTGDTLYLEDSNAWHTRVTAPGGANITITSNYFLGVLALQATVAQVPGTDTGTSANRVTTPDSPGALINIGYQIPSSHPRGIIFEFHGTFGSYGNWFSQVDKAIFNSAALQAGFGIVAVNSAAPGYWDYKTTYPKNLDFQNVQATIKYLEQLGVMSSADKLYGIGDSDGGYFESAVARVLGFSASALNIAGGLAPYFDPSVNVPTANGVSHMLMPSIWALAQQDGTSGVSMGGIYPEVIGIGPSGIEQGHCNAVELLSLASPVPTCNSSIVPNPFLDSIADLNFYMNPPSPAYPARFALIPGLSTSTAQAIFTWMQSQGCIDANGNILSNPYQSVDWNAPTVNFKCSQTPLEQQFGGEPYNLTSDQAGDLMDQFLIAFAEHKFMSEFTDKILAFFEAR